MQQGRATACPCRSFNQLPMRRFFDSRNLPLVLLFAAVIFAYGVFIPWFGFYGDDWIYLYNFHLLGAGSFSDFVAVDRPFSGWLYTLVTPLFKETALPYHLFLLGLRWLSGALFWWVLRYVWPQKEKAITWAALFFVLYPGFQQQPIAVQFILHFTVLNLFLFSLAAMLLAAGETTATRRFWGWTLTGVVAGLVSIFTMEYFAGLELIRPVLLWVVLARLFPRRSERLKRTGLLWLPYFLAAVAFGIWRGLIFKFPTYQPSLLNSLLNNPRAGLLDLVKRVIQDLKIVNFDAWRQGLALPDERSLWPLFAALVLASFAFFWWSLQRAQTGEESGVVDRSPYTLAAFGLFAMLVGAVPFWIPLVRLELAFPWDRSTLAFFFGASIFMAGVIELALHQRVQLLAVAALAALAVGVQMRSASEYRWEARAMNAYFWQMAWRIPGLEPGTILASDAIPLYRHSDNDLTPVVNWQYAPELRGDVLEYKYFDLSTRPELPFSLTEADAPVKHRYRNHSFSGTTAGVLPVYYRDGGCFWVLGAQDGDFPGLPETIRQTLPLAHPQRVLAQGSAVPPRAIGPEPQHDWCYTFARVSLALQTGQVEEAARLAQEGLAAGDQPKYALDWLPAVEALALNGDVDPAGVLIEQTLTDEANRPFVCNRINRLADRISANSLAALQQRARCEP